MKFSRIPGQEKLKSDLIMSVQNNRIPHSLLFLGDNGYGALALAYAFASYVQCKNKSENDKCGVCSACKKTEKIIHADIAFTLPTIINSKNPNEPNILMKLWRNEFLSNPYLSLNDWAKNFESEIKLPNIFKDDVIAVSQYFDYALFEGNKKIMIIWCPELMEKEGNRLLKLIEEPPQDSLIILVSNDSSKILKTILSRCQIYRLPPLEDHDLELILAEHKEQSESTNLDIINLADGNVNKLLKLLGSENNHNYKMLLNWLNVSYKANAVKIMELAEDFSRLSKDQIKNFFTYNAILMEQILLSFHLPEEKLKMNQNERETSIKIKKLMDQHDVIDFIDLLNKLIFSVGRNANVKLLLFHSCLQINNIFKKTYINN